MADSVEVIYDGSADTASGDDGAPEGHNQKMVDVADGVDTASEKETPPEWLPEKYARWDDAGKLLLDESARELAKANAELNKRFTQQQQDKPKDPPEAQDGDNQTDEAVKGAIGAELFTELQAEFDQAGDLSADSRQKLADLGFPEEIVNNYLAGRQATVQLYQSQVYSAAGGADEYNALIDWASANMTKQQADFINAGLKSGNIEQAQAAVRSLAAMRSAAGGPTGDLLSGDGPSGRGAGFRSRAEMTKAMRDPRYSSDEAYRADVISKVRWSNF